MSYSILITAKDEGKRDIPFSTTKNYREILLPIANALQLAMIIDIQYGRRINNNNELKKFISELQKIKESSLIHTSDRYNSERIDFSIEELKAVLTKKQYVFIDIG